MKLKLLAFESQVKSGDGKLYMNPAGILDVETVDDNVDIRVLWRGESVRCKRCLFRPFEGEEALLVHCDYPLLIDSCGSNDCVSVSFIQP